MPSEMGPIPLCEPMIQGNEWEYLKECLDTGWVSSAGPSVQRFERAVADYLGARHAVATVNGTAALHLALLVAGVQPDDEVLVPTLTFIAPVNAIRYSGAWPVFMDAEADYWQMDPAKTVEFLEDHCRWSAGSLVNKVSGRRVKAILPVHMLGHPCNVDPLVDAARKYDLAVIEDATESLGSRYRGRMAGRLADIACLSFNGNKIITTGGGGMVVTDDEQWADRVRHLSTQAKSDPVEYVHDEIGFNYRLTNLQAAIGVAQMEQLDGYVESKRRIARFYNERFADMAGIATPWEAPWATTNAWLYTVLVDRQAYGLDRGGLMDELGRRHIQSRPLFHPVHRLPPYRDCQAFRVEIADDLHGRGLSLPCSVGISEEDLLRVSQAIADCSAAIERGAERPAGTLS